MKTCQYKGYTAKYHLLGGKWSAVIYPPTGRLALGALPTATEDEGEEELLTRVRAAIDADI